MDSLVSSVPRCGHPWAGARVGRRPPRPGWPPGLRASGRTDMATRALDTTGTPTATGITAKPGRNGDTEHMVAARKDPIRAVEELLDAMAALRESTRATETAIRRALKKADRGVDLPAVLAALDPASARNTMNNTLKAVEQARHETRLAVFAMALDEGTSIGELGRIFGFSRQLAARYAKEARQN